MSSKHQVLICAAIFFVIRPWPLSATNAPSFLLHFTPILNEPHPPTLSNALTNGGLEPVNVTLGGYVKIKGSAV